MRHRVASKQLQRDTKHRSALIMNLMRQLIEHGSITTTSAKAKVVQPVADKLMTKAKKGDVAARRSLHSFFGKRDVVNTLVDKIAPVMSDRTSGFTRITEVGTRSGDSATLVTLAWVSQPATQGLTGEKAGLQAAQKKSAAPKKAPAKKAAEKPAAKKTTKTEKK